MPQVSISALCTVLALCAGGCNGDIHVSAPPPPNQAPVVTILFGNNQTGPAGDQLPGTLLFEVKTIDGKPLMNEKVVWSTTNGGWFSQVTGTTDHTGSTSAHWTLGPGTGTQRAEATLPRFGQGVVFSATATKQPN